MWFCFKIIYSNKCSQGLINHETFNLISYVVLVNFTSLKSEVFDKHVVQFLYQMFVWRAEALAQSF